MNIKKLSLYSLIFLSAALYSSEAPEETTLELCKRVKSEVATFIHLHNQEIEKLEQLQETEPSHITKMLLHDKKKIKLERASARESLKNCRETGKVLAVELGNQTNLLQKKDETIAQLEQKIAALEADKGEIIPGLSPSTAPNEGEEDPRIALLLTQAAHDQKRIYQLRLISAATGFTALGFISKEITMRYAPELLSKLSTLLYAYGTKPTPSAC